MIDPTTHQLIFLWRHADAASISADSPTDIQRQLTALGVQQAQQMAKWLACQLPEDITVFSSPAKRTLQTATSLGKEIVIVDKLAPGASLLEVLTGLHDAQQNHMTAQNVVIVGHQPWIGQLANYLERHPSLLAENTVSVVDRSFKKAEVLCFKKPLSTPSALFELYQSKSAENL